MRLVDADAELKRLETLWISQDTKTTEAFGMYVNFLKNAPTVSIEDIINEKDKNMRNTVQN